MDQNNLNNVADRIASAAAVFAPGHQPSARQKADAAAILRDMLQAVELHGLTFAHFDDVADFPRLALQLVKHRDEEK